VAPSPHLNNAPLHDPIPELNPLTLKYLQHSLMHHPSLQSGMEKAREAMGSSTLGICFSHYMAGTFTLEILVINSPLTNTPLCTGFSYDCWKKGINVMIEKTCSNFNVKNLRIILLFKANFNANNKWLGHVIMYQAEQAHLLAHKQYGSCKFKSAIYQCLNKQLLYDVIQFKQWLAALCSNDAKSCYNCITLLVAALCLHCFGGSQVHGG